MQRVALPPKLMTGGEAQVAPKGAPGPVTEFGSTLSKVMSNGSAGEPIVPAAAVVIVAPPMS